LRKDGLTEPLNKIIIMSHGEGIHYYNNFKLW